MTTKQQVFVHLKNEEIKEKAIQVLTKHNENHSDLNDFSQYPYLKFDTESKSWVSSDYHNGGIAEISVETLDEILKNKPTEPKSFKWLININNPNIIICSEPTTYLSFGFNSNGDWIHNSSGHYIYNPNNFRLATLQEVSSRLIEEAISRGLTKGVSIISPGGIDYGHVIISDKLNFSFDTNTLFCVDNGVNLFHHGKWAVVKKRGVKISSFPVNTLDSKQKNNDNIDFDKITNSISDLLKYKNSKYGNTILDPLKIFANKCKAGHEIDKKLSRVKNANVLRKNDVVDIIGYLVLVCVENNWDSFDEFKD